MTRILLTNDDGIASPGIAALRRALEPIGEVVTIAPHENRSAIARSITIGRTVHVEKVTFGEGFDGFSLDGTPVDCVRAATLGALCEAPDLVVAGVNLGPNMGQDVTYSGTVGAALEGVLLGLPAFAVSIMSRRPAHLADVVALIPPLVSRVCEQGMPAGVALNVNLPDIPAAAVGGVAITRLGRAVYDDRMVVEDGADGSHSYRIQSEMTLGQDRAGTDFDAVSRGLISITPLRTDWCDEASLTLLEEWALGRAITDPLRRAPAGGGAG
jgi:5'-nucleotidase